MSAALAPADEAGIAVAVGEAAARAEPLIVIGNASKSTFLRPVQAARTLSTRNLAGITFYSPKELVISARAGTPVADIEMALAEQNQHLIAEPPDLTALLATPGSPASGPQTIGGVVAANLSGPRRISAGAMRDHVLGIRAVNGSGEVIRSGGRVLKNVTGLDLCKLLTGSFGTLAVMTEITLKVLPRPERAGTVVLAGLDARAGVAALSQALGSPFGVSAAAWMPEVAAARVPELAQFGASTALMRIEDLATSVPYRIAQLSALLSPASATVLDEAGSHAVWRAVRDAQPLAAGTGDAIWRVSVRPSRGHDILAALERAVGANGYLDWGGGLLWVAAPAQEDAHSAVVRATRAAGGTWMLVRAPDPLRAAVEVVPPEPESLARITRRVKAAFDPKGILNPGRMYTGL
jgi:glycolate oxidase FAD binding subunit